MTTRSAVGLSFLSVMMILNLGCNDSSSSAPPPPADPNTNNDNAAITPPPVQAEFVDAKNWDSLNLLANFAKTQIDTAAHFVTTRNACGKDAMGSVTISTWNIIATDVNAAIVLEPLKDENLFCIPFPDSMKMDGTLDVALTGGKKREIYSNRGGQICSTISNPQLSNELLNAINQVVVAADREDCPNGFGH